MISDYAKGKRKNIDGKTFRGNKSKSFRQNLFKSDSILSGQNNRGEEVVDYNEKDPDSASQLSRLPENKNFLSFVNEAIIREIILDQHNSDSDTDFENTLFVETQKDKVRKAGHICIYRSIKEAIARVKKPHVFVCLTDINREHNQSLQKIDKVTYKWIDKKEMMAMKQSSKMTKCPDLDAEKMLPNSDDRIKEEELSLKDLKSMLMSGKTILESDNHEKERVVKSAPVTPKKGRKPKSTESSPTTPEKGEKKSPGKRSRKSSPAAANDISTEMVTPGKKMTADAESNSKKGKSSASPRRPRKDKDTGESTDTPDSRGKSTLENSGKNTQDNSGKKKSKGKSESPSPRRKQSPKKGTAVQASEDSVELSKDDIKSKGAEKKSTKKKDQCKALKHSPGNEANTKLLNKKPPEKSPKARKKKENNFIDPEGDSTPNSKTKKQKQKSDSTSPKRSGKKMKQKNTSPTNGAVRALDFEEGDVRERILQSANFNLPSDFKYEYKSKTGDTVDLTHLIDKVNSAIKDKPANLVALFGSDEELDTTSTSDASGSGETVDSDKTITDLDVTNKSQEIEDTNTPSHEIPVDKKMRTDSIEETEKTAELDTIKSSSDPDMKSDNVKINCDTSMNNKNTSEGHDIADEEDSDREDVRTVSVFEMFGLKLKRNIKKDTECQDALDKCESADKEKSVDDINDEKAELLTKNVDSVIHEDDDVMIISEHRASESIVISDDDQDDAKAIDRSGYISLNETVGCNKCKPKFTTVNNIVEPKPLEILSWPEKMSNKETAFCSPELEEYLEENKENQGGSQKAEKSEILKSKIKEELEKSEADIDDVDGFVFVSFENEKVLKAHISLERNTDWLNESLLKKLAQLKVMKERQMDAGSKRVTDVKSLDEQKQSFRGVPMRMLKYQKLLKQELENILTGKQIGSPNKSPSKTPQKTADITKIKGWKTKFQNAEELQEATGISISESGKVHWKTEERLLKNLDPEDVKDIGLDLKKKRRKIVSYTMNKRKSFKDGKGDGNHSFEYELDESVITERDVYNEEDEKPLPEKIPYSVKYHSQHKYGARKLFVRRMKLDAEDERILKKLGTQKLFFTKEEEDERLLTKMKKSKLGLGRLTQSMAIAAVSALDKKLIMKAKKLAKVSWTYCYVNKTF